MRGDLAWWLWGFLCLQVLKKAAVEAPLQFLIIWSLHHYPCLCQCICFHMRMNTTVCLCGGPLRAPSGGSICICICSICTCICVCICIITIYMYQPPLPDMYTYGYAYAYTYTYTSIYTYTFTYSDEIMRIWSGASPAVIFNSCRHRNAHNHEARAPRIRMSSRI